MNLYSLAYTYESAYKIFYSNVNLCFRCTPLLERILTVSELGIIAPNFFLISPYAIAYIADFYNNNYEMMFNFLTTFKFHRFCQSGLYFDYFFKKITEAFIRNFLIYTAQFFGEKFMIEYWTKLIVSNTVFNLNGFISWTSLSYKWFFLQLITFIIYSLLLVNILEFILF